MISSVNKNSGHQTQCLVKVGLALYIVYWGIASLVTQFYLNNRELSFIDQLVYLYQSVWYKQWKSRRCWEVKLFPREVSKDTLTTP